MTEIQFDLLMFAFLLVFGMGTLTFHLWHMERDKRLSDARRNRPNPAE